MFLWFWWFEVWPPLSSAFFFYPLRVSRAASVLLSDPCFQLHSIQHLLGEGGDSSSTAAAVASSIRPVVGSLGSTVAPPIPSAAGNTASSERKHFSLHACESNPTFLWVFRVFLSDVCGVRGRGALWVLYVPSLTRKKNVLNKKGYNVLLIRFVSNCPSWFRPHVWRC